MASLDSAPQPGASKYSEAEQALFAAFTAHQAGRLDAAVVSYRRAIAAQPDFPEALNNLGIALKDLHRFEDAVVAYRDALRLRPDSPEIWNNLGDSLHSLGDRDGAIEHYRRALAINPKYGICWRNLGDALLESGTMEEAEECFRKGIACAPGLLDLTLSPAELGMRQLQSYFVNMVKEIEAAAARDPEFAGCYVACGSGKKAATGASKATVERFRFAAKLRQSYVDHLSSVLGAMHYDSTPSPSSLHHAHTEADRFFSELPRFTAWSNSREPERRLRIGYVSADFRSYHSVGYFLAAVFDASDRAAVENYCYAGCADNKESAFFKSRAFAWRSTIDKSDEDVANAVRDDGIDILVDLAGHTYGNRLGVFARHPAPIQVTWLGYSNTTGLSSIDYRLTDGTVDPPGAADALTSERLFRMPRGFHCYTAPADAPDVTPLSASGPVTFGSFNNLIKVNAAVLDLWAAVLNRVAGSRLLLKAKWLDLPEMRLRVLHNLEHRGIARERIELLTKMETTAEHLAAYSRIDIALDTFPYNGVTTTCEALWMGVPVVTLVGDRHAGRVGASLLSQVGLDELVAAHPDAYVAIAERLANDRDRLAALRSGLRARLSASALCDAPRFAGELEAAYRVMWRTWCRRIGP